MRAEKRLAKRRARGNFRVRNVIRKSVSTRPRLSVFRSNSHIYVQIIDDAAGETLAAARSLEKGIAGAGKFAGNKDTAAKVGRLIAERALDKGIKEVVFDRGRYKYHGRVAALAAAAREGGLEF